MTPKDQRTRRGMEAKARDIGRVIGSQMPPGWGFALLLFEFGQGGNASYISNADRADMVHALREQADRLERHLDTPPFSEN